MNQSDFTAGKHFFNEINADVDSTVRSYIDDRMEKPISTPRRFSNYK